MSTWNINTSKGTLALPHTTIQVRLTARSGVSVAALTVISTLGALLPFSQRLSGSRASMAPPLVCFNLFSGGVIFGVCLGHMLADAVETLGHVTLTPQSAWHPCALCVWHLSRDGVDTGDAPDDSAFTQFPWATTLFG